VQETAGDAILDRRVWDYEGTRAIERPPATADLQRTADSLAGSAHVFDDMPDGDVRLYAAPVTVGGRQVGTVVAAQSLVAYDRTTDLALLGSLALAAVLLAAVGVYATRATPFAVTGQPPLLKSTEDVLLQAVSRTRLERLDRAVLASNYAKSSPPRTLEDAVNQALVDRSYLRDPWARPYHYALTGNGYLLSGVDDAGKKVGTPIERVLPPKQP
jgi:hypothetical protein